MSKNHDLEVYYYLNIWLALFAEFLGWTKEQTIEWARVRKILYVDKQSLWYCDRPQDIVMGFVCGQLLKDKLRFIYEYEAADIILDVECRVTTLNQFIPDFGNIDLKWYHAEVDKILSEYR